jgi:hypothetical protein
MAVDLCEFERRPNELEERQNKRRMASGFRLNENDSIVRAGCGHWNRRCSSGE